ncbi:hypothetical protein DIPPA_25095, partial [Diplonema papillatum]
MMPMNGTCQNMQLASPLFVRAVTQRYLQSDTAVRKTKSALSRYLYAASERADSPFTVRSLRMYPRLMAEAGMWHSVTRCFFSHGTIRKAFSSGVGYVLFREMCRSYELLCGLLETVEARGGSEKPAGAAHSFLSASPAKPRVPTAEETGGKEGGARLEAPGGFSAEDIYAMLFLMKEYVHFVHGNLGIFSSKPHLVVQQALQSYADGSVYAEAKKHYERHPEESFLVCANKRTTKMFAGPVSGAAYAGNGLKAVAAGDRAFAVLNTHGETIHHVTTPTPVTRALVSSTNRYVVVAAGDKTLAVYAVS